MGVDAKDGFVAIHGWKEVSAEKGVDFCRRLADAGCAAIIYTDIACDGAMQGHESGAVPPAGGRGAGRGLHGQRRHLVGSRAVGTEKMGTAAAILGKSLYTGALDLKRCVELVQN